MSKCPKKTKMRKIPFKKKEFYHIYNRGVDKRNIFENQDDFRRFFRSILEFNTVEPIGSIFENSVRKRNGETFGHPMSKLVNIICYCVNPNHYHFILEPLTDGGIEKFMQKLGNGYTKYFNHKYGRSGVLFQGKFKSVHIDSNEYLLHLSAYINLNDRVHKITLGHPMSKTSWGEYVRSDEAGLCDNKEIVLGQFRNKQEYENFAKKALDGIIERKEITREIRGYLLEI